MILSVCAALITINDNSWYYIVIFFPAKWKYCSKLVGNKVTNTKCQSWVTSDVVEIVTSETETWLKFRDETETKTLS